MGLFAGIAGALADSGACIMLLCIKKLSGKVDLNFLSSEVDLNFLSSEIIVCYCQEGKYSGYR